MAPLGHVPYIQCIIRRIPVLHAKSENRIKSGMEHYYRRNYPSLSRNVEEWNF